MLLLTIVFICNTFAFALILEERFKLLTTAIFYACGLGLSAITNLILSGFSQTAESAGFVAVCVNVFWLLIISVFVSSNNILQKLLVALILVTNYTFVADFSFEMFAFMPFDTSGISGLLIANGIYMLFTLITIAFLANPLHYFFRRSISPSSMVLCIVQFLALQISLGFLNDILLTNSFNIRFFACLTLYIFVIFSLRSSYGAAIYKVKNVTKMAQSEVTSVRGDNFNTMYVNINSYKTVKKNLDYQLDRISDMATTGKVREIPSYVELAKQSNANSPLLGNYSENPFVNSLVATKVAFAKTKDISVDANISLTEFDISVIELCFIISELLNIGISSCEKSSSAEKFVHLTIVPASRQLIIEAVYNESVASKISLTKTLKNKTLFGMANSLFERKHTEEKDSFENITEIIEEYSGSLSITHSNNSVIARVAIND